MNESMDSCYCYFMFYTTRLGEVFGPETQPTEEEFLDFYAQYLYKHGNRVFHG